MEAVTIYGNDHENDHGKINDNDDDTPIETETLTITTKAITIMEAISTMEAITIYGNDREKDHEIKR